MNANDLLDMIGNADDAMIEDAEKRGKRAAPRWMKYAAAAACLCVAAVCAVTLIPKFHSIPTAGVGGNNAQPGGAEASSYSLAVLPAGRTIEEVESARCDMIGEDALKKETGLCEYAPAALPQGYRFDTASLYETTMKDGAVYRMLLLTYRSGAAPEAPGGAQEEAAAQIPAAPGSEFRVYVYDFRPNTAEKIYAPEELCAELENGSAGSGFICFAANACYVGLEPLSLTPGEILSLVNSITE